MVEILIDSRAVNIFPLLSPEFIFLRLPFLRLMVKICQFYRLMSLAILRLTMNPTGIFLNALELPNNTFKRVE